MNIKQCPVCGTANHIVATFCHSCGARLDDEARYDPKPDTTEPKFCPCGHPQTFPIPHEHDQTNREKAIIGHFQSLFTPQDELSGNPETLRLTLLEDIPKDTTSPKDSRYATQGELEDVLPLLVCEVHLEIFSNNCSECMLISNDPQTIKEAYKRQLKHDQAQIKKLKAYGWVELDEKQELPKIAPKFLEAQGSPGAQLIRAIVDIEGYIRVAQQDMLSAGFRKVKGQPSEGTEC